MANVQQESKENIIFNPVMLRECNRLAQIVKQFEGLIGERRVPNEFLQAVNLPPNNMFSPARYMPMRQRRRLEVDDGDEEIQAIPPPVQPQRVVTQPHLREAFSTATQHLQDMLGVAASRSRYRLPMRPSDENNARMGHSRHNPVIIDIPPEEAIPPLEPVE
jgi:hypothetical protein